MVVGLERTQNGVKVTPEKVELKEGQRGIVIVEWRPEKMGMLSTVISVNVPQDQNSSKVINVKGVAIKSSYLFLDEEGMEVTKISFKDMYLGEKTTKTYTFVNNTAKQVRLRLVSVGIHPSLLLDKSHHLLPSPSDILSPQKYAS